MLVGFSWPPGSVFCLRTHLRASKGWLSPPKYWTLLPYAWLFTRYRADEQGQSLPGHSPEEDCRNHLSQCREVGIPPPPLLHSRRLLALGIGTPLRSKRGKGKSTPMLSERLPLWSRKLPWMENGSGQSTVNVW